jgi:hypothetical protein
MKNSLSHTVWVVNIRLFGGVSRIEMSSLSSKLKCQELEKILMGHEVVKEVASHKDVDSGSFVERGNSP